MATKKKAAKKPRKGQGPAKHEHAHGNHDHCHDEDPTPEKRDELPYPIIPRKELEGRGKAVSLVIDASGAGPKHRFVRADLEILGLDHSGATYDGLIFFNNKRANAKTPRDESKGFAGLYRVFGHGQCYGDAGHCEIPKRRAEDYRRPHALERIKQYITVTDAIRKAAAKSSKVTVTIVPVLQAATTGCDLDDVIRFERLRLLTYNQ